MTQSVTPNAGQPRKRPGRAAGAVGAKMLITAASLTAVVGGWAVFTLQQAAEASQAVDPGAAPEPVDPAALAQPPLPTLIPEPGSLQAVVGLPLAAPLAGPGALPVAGSLPPAATPLPIIPGINAPKGSGGPDTPNKPSKPKAQKPKSNGNTRSSK